MNKQEHNDKRYERQQHDFKFTITFCRKCLYIYVYIKLPIFTISLYYIALYMLKVVSLA